MRCHTGRYHKSRWLALFDKWLVRLLWWRSQVDIIWPQPNSSKDLAPVSIFFLALNVRKNLQCTTVQYNFQFPMHTIIQDPGMRIFTSNFQHCSAILQHKFLMLFILYLLYVHYNHINYCVPFLLSFHLFVITAI